MPTAPRPDALRALAPDAVLKDRYRLREFLGAGAFGAVWRAYDPNMGQDVAIKVLRGVHAENEAGLQGVRAEASILRLLRHPNIVALHTIEIDPPFLMLVFDLVQGPNLNAVLAQRRDESRALTSREALWVLAGVAAALDAAHERRIRHQDVKPANIMLTHAPGGPLGEGAEEIRLMDFGIAIVARTTQTGSTTSDAHDRAGGTPGYMAPEVYIGARLSRRSDVYSLAVTVYELVRGVKPFEGPTFDDFRRQTLHDRPPPLRSGDAALDRAVMAGLERNPKLRPRSAGEMLTIARGEASSAKEKRRSRALVALAVISACAAALSLVLTGPPGSAVATTVRVPSGWVQLDGGAGHGGWARRVQDPKTGVVFVLVPPDGPVEVEMGSADSNFPNEQPPESVTIRRPFYLSETEITQAQWCTRLDTLGWKRANGDSLPAWGVSWYDAVEYCQGPGVAERDRYELPTECEWESACRLFQESGGDADVDTRLAAYAHFGDRSKSATVVRCGSLKPNPWGLFDMQGNVAEWCSDPYAIPAACRSLDTIAPPTTPQRVLRGGAFHHDAEHCRPAYRLVFDAGRPDRSDRSVWSEHDWIGFRVKKSIEP